MWSKLDIDSFPQTPHEAVEEILLLKSEILVSSIPGTITFNSLPLVTKSLI